MSKKKRKLDAIARLILFVFIGLFLSGFYMFYVEKINHDYFLEKNWYSVYFKDPKSDNLNFRIENFYHGDLKYSYHVFDENKNLILENQTGVLKPNQKKLIEFENNLKSGKIEIELQVNLEGEEIKKSVILKK
jgi:hypothetical protein